MKEKIKLGVGCFVAGCCDTAFKSIIVLPEGANVFKRIGKSLISWYGADKIATYYMHYVDSVATMIEDVKADVKENIDKVKEAMEGAQNEG